MVFRREAKIQQLLRCPNAEDHWVLSPAVQTRTACSAFQHQHFGWRVPAARPPELVYWDVILTRVALLACPLRYAKLFPEAPARTGRGHLRKQNPRRFPAGGSVRLSIRRTALPVALSAEQEHQVVLILQFV